MTNKFDKKISNYVIKKLIDYPLPFTSFNLRFQHMLKKINMETHQWVSDDDTLVCAACDCRFGSHPSEWPCGYPVPRSSDVL